DDGKPCTADRCDPASGCTHAPGADGPTAGCSDNDDCTNDVCSAGACVSSLPPGLSGATCRVTALQHLIDTLDLPKQIRKKPRARAKSITKRLPIAMGTNAKKAKKAAKQVKSSLKALAKTVSKARGKIDGGAPAQVSTASPQA